MSDSRVGYWSKIDPSSEAFEPEVWPFYNVTHLVALYYQRMEAQLKPIEMDVPRWRVLMLLHRVEAATITSIAYSAVTKISTMAKIIQRMSAQGLVLTRTSSEDARSTEVAITDLGRSKLEAVRAKVSLISRQAFHGISESELKLLGSVASRIGDNLRI